MICTWGIKMGTHYIDYKGSVNSKIVQFFNKLLFFPGSEKGSPDQVRV